MKAQAGLIALATSWPAWERYGQRLPHPILVLGVLANGNVLVAPITTKGALCRLSVPITAAAYPSAYPPLDARRDPSYVCLRDKDGETIHTVDWHAGNLRLPKGIIGLSGHRVLAPTEWQRLWNELRAARSP